MNGPTWLLVAATLVFAVGLAHSVLGEKYILIRLFRRPDLPKLLGGTEFTVRTLRFAWHLTTIAWWGSGAMLVLAARGRHLAWPVFATIGLIALYAAGLGSLAR